MHASPRTPTRMTAVSAAAAPAPALAPAAAPSGVPGPYYAAYKASSAAAAAAVPPPTRAAPPPPTAATAARPATMTTTAPSQYVPRQTAPAASTAVPLDRPTVLPAHLQMQLGTIQTARTVTGGAGTSVHASGSQSVRTPATAATTASGYPVRTTSTTAAPTPAAVPSATTPTATSSFTSSIRPAVSALTSAARPHTAAAATIPAPITTSTPTYPTSPARRNQPPLQQPQPQAQAAKPHTNILTDAALVNRFPSDASERTTSSVMSSPSSSSTTSSRSTVLSPHSSRLLSAVTTGRTAAPTFVNRSLEDQDLLNLTYGSQIVLRVSTGKFVSVDEVPAKDRDDHAPRFTVHAASPNAYPFTILNAVNLSDRSEVKFQDSIVLLAADGTFLSAEGAGAQSDDAPIGGHRRELTDVRTKWYLLCGHADLLSGAYARAGGVVKIFDLVLLKSFMSTLLAVDEADIAGTVHHRERAPRPIQVGAAPPSQPCVLHMARAHLPIVPDWLRNRGGSLSIAPPGSTLAVSESSLSDNKPLGDFNEQPAEVQEQLLLEDLLYALVGVEGKYIRLVQKEGQEERVSFVPSPHIKDLSLVESLSRLLPLCSSYFSIQTYIQIHSRWEYGLVTHAFSACLRTILKEYLVLVAQLEFQFASRNLTLLRAWYYLQASLHSLSRLDALCQRVNRTAGGTFLNVLYQAMNHAGDESTKALYTHLLVHASVPYFDMLNSWLTQGTIHDVYDEFQVKQHAERSKENIRKDFNDTYWDERYTVRTEKVPAFLASMTERILTTGKYLNVIRECGRGIPPSGSTLRPLLHYSSNERDYIDTVDSAYAFASRLLLDLLLHENDLLGRLRSLKRYFLGGQGDFFVHFMDTAATDLQSNTKDILLPRLRSHLDLALRTSRACVDPYLQDLSCQTQPWTLVQQLERIHSTTNTSISGGGLPLATSKRNDLLKGHETVELCYRVRWPLSLVLSKKTLTKYQLLFRHLFAIKHAERSLNQCWGTHQSLKEMQIGRQYHHSFGLRQRMLHFFHNMAYYIMVEVLEPNWHQLETSLATVTTVDEVLRLHHAFLDTCLKQCLLTHQTLLKIINKLSITALFFAQHADTSINSHVPEPLGDEDSDSDEYAKRRPASMDDFIDGVTRRKPMSLRHRQKHVLDTTYATLQSIQDDEHVKFIKANATRFDNLVFEFLAALRAKSATHSSDAHFSNLFNRLDFNDWFSTAEKQQHEAAVGGLPNGGGGGGGSSVHSRAQSSY